MKNPAFYENQFVDATSISGLNAALGLVSGSIATLGMANFPAPGLISPESMSLSFAGLVATVGLPPPWGLITSGGVVVHAHGALTGQDTTSYSVNFASLIPATGTVTAYLTATVNQIQQNPFPLVGPPQGHPSFNPNFIPATAYASTVFSVALATSTTLPNNTTVFELARTTLSAGQGTISTSQSIGWYRAGDYTAMPTLPLATGGVLTLANAQTVLKPSVTGLTHTLPAVATAGGLTYQLINPQAVAAWTIAAAGSDRIIGATGAQLASLALPPGGSIKLNAGPGTAQWDLVAANPIMMASLPNVFTAVQTINAVGATAGLIVSGGTSIGTSIQIIGNGTTNPNKYLRVFNGTFAIINSAYTAVPFSMDDTGNTVIAGQLASNALVVAANATIGTTLQVNGAISSNSNIVAAGVVNGSSLNSTVGAITASTRLRAVLGAFGSGDTNAATLLSDFLISTAANYIYQRLPSGFIIQGYQGVNATGADNIFFPNAFPNACIQCLAHEAAPSGWAGASPTIMGTQNLNPNAFALYVTKYNGVAWTYAGSISYRYIAIGF